jgi:selenide,water dikinase
VAARLLLVGGGHAHVEVLRVFAATPEPGLDITLISPGATLLYSGMVPGVIAGHYALADAGIALAPLVAAARGRFVDERAVALDLDRRRVALRGGGSLAFDWLSLDIGSTPDRSIPGAHAHAIAARPLSALVDAWAATQAEATAQRVRTIAVVGGGAAGVELLLSMQRSALRDAAGPAPSFVLVTAAPAMVPDHPAAVRRRLERIVARRGVAVRCASPATAVSAAGVIVASGETIAADRVILATSAVAAQWLGAAGLACDAGGFVRLDAYLRSVSHPFVFAAGDCAAQDGMPRPKSGVYAVRAGPPLAQNLRRAMRGEALVAYRPQAHALAIISTGNRHAIASRPPLTVECDWVWRWKDWIDRRFVARYAVRA